MNRPIGHTENRAELPMAAVPGVPDSKCSF
jgi:hypothetical protein